MIANISARAWYCYLYIDSHIRGSRRISAKEQAEIFSRFLSDVSASTQLCGFSPYPQADFVCLYLRLATAPCEEPTQKVV